MSPDHPDYATEMDAHLVRLSLFIGLIRMEHAPEMDSRFADELSIKYFGHPMSDRSTADPLTDEPLDYRELMADIVTSPQHGYSRFHIGHQRPSQQPKHLPGNVRWQLKASNDFQGTMDVPVGRIAYRIDEYARSGNESMLQEALHELEQLRKGEASRFDAP